MESSCDGQKYYNGMGLNLAKGLEMDPKMCLYCWFFNQGL